MPQVSRTAIRVIQLVSPVNELKSFLKGSRFARLRSTRVMAVRMIE